MVRIPPKVRERLKRPLGPLQTDFKGLRSLGKTHRIISVGDVCTLGLLAMGIRPHLAVFDHVFMRRALDIGMRRVLELSFKKPRHYANPAGTISEKILSDAGRLISEGGAVLIDGEEDLTALAFIRSAGSRDIIIYGQPGRGIIVVRPDKKIKKMIDKWLSAAALGHEVKCDVGKKR